MVAIEVICQSTPHVVREPRSAGHIKPRRDLRHHTPRA